MSNGKVVALIDHARRAERDAIYSEWRMAIAEFRIKLEQLQGRLEQLERGVVPPLNGQTH